MQFSKFQKIFQDPILPLFSRHNFYHYFLIEKWSITTTVFNFTAVLAPGRPDGRPRPDTPAYTPFRTLHTRPASPELEEREGTAPLVRKNMAATSYGCLTDAGMRTHRDEAAKDEEEDTTPDLLLKHPDATLAI